MKHIVALLLSFNSITTFACLNEYYVNKQGKHTTGYFCNGRPEFL
jgi:hypothetical protein